VNALAPADREVQWSDLDRKAVDTVRVLSADAVEKAGNGHPGTAISLAPVAYLLYQNRMRLDPNDALWLGRDRFVLSAGHSGLTQYIQLYLAGFGLELEDLQALRTWGSRTPGHPEFRTTTGIEITTGPLGQGIASSVGMAMAARRERGLFDPDAAPGTSPFDHSIYVIASDGDLQEGVSAEASSIAGTQELGNLTVIWDDNHISIEGDTDIAFTEDVMARYAAYGWHVQFVDWTNGGKDYVEDVESLNSALDAATADLHRPSIIGLRTIIAWPAPTAQNTHGAHGSKLGAAEVRSLKEILGFDPDKAFDIDPAVLAHTRKVGARSAAAHAEWEGSYQAWRTANPDKAALLDRIQAGDLPNGWSDSLPAFPAGEAVATRAASGMVLSALAPVLPELWGGSADLAGSNNTTMKGEPSFLPTHRSTKQFAGDEYGRTLHFGICEHAMGAILSGIALHGPTRPYGGTFFTFSDYMRGAVRLASLMGIAVTYVWTHDSIGLGEDGPTHQPVEHLAAARAIPGLTVLRPADANETVQAWKSILERNSGPVALILTRQNVPTLPRGEDGFAAAEGLDKGAYVLVEASAGTPDVILIGTGSEVQLAVAARKTLESEGIATRVVSMPSQEWFAEQDHAYSEHVLPRAGKARVSVEAGIALSWHKLVGDAGRSIFIERYGASAPGEAIYAAFGVTASAVTAAAKESIAEARGDAAALSTLAAATHNGVRDQL